MTRLEVKRANRWNSFLKKPFADMWLKIRLFTLESKKKLTARGGHVRTTNPYAEIEIFNNQRL